VKDWFRRSTWSANDRDDFEVRLRRARPAGRPQYLHIQPVHLWETGQDDLLRPALDLLTRLLADYPDSMEVSAAEHLRARCHDRLGETLLAAEAYRAAIKAESQRPSARTDAALDFALLVAERKLASLYDETAALLDQRREELRPFPVQRFKYHAARALLASSGDAGTAREEARLALKEAEANQSGFRYHSQLGLVGGHYESLREHLEIIAAG
jgi:hypothetical protein